MSKNYRKRLCLKSLSYLFQRLGKKSIDSDIALTKFASNKCGGRDNKTTETVAKYLFQYFKVFIDNMRTKIVNNGII